MISVSRYFLQKQVAWNINLSTSINEHFAGVIGEGHQLRDCISKFKKVIRLTEDFKKRIELYLESCERAIIVLGEEVLNEFCELMNVLEYLQYHRALVIRHMNQLMNA